MNQQKEEGIILPMVHFTSQVFIKLYPPTPTFQYHSVFGLSERAAGFSPSLEIRGVPFLRRRNARIRMQRLSSPFKKKKEASHVAGKYRSLASVYALPRQCEIKYSLMFSFTFGHQSYQGVYFHSRK